MNLVVPRNAVAAMPTQYTYASRLPNRRDFASFPSTSVLGPSANTRKSWGPLPHDEAQVQPDDKEQAVNQYLV